MINKKTKKKFLVEGKCQGNSDSKKNRQYKKKTNKHLKKKTKKQNKKPTDQG